MLFVTLVASSIGNTQNTFTACPLLIHHRCIRPYSSLPIHASQKQLVPHRTQAIWYWCYHFDCFCPCENFKLYPFIHIKLTLQQLYTHATLMFGNSCLTGLEYEATTSAIVMAGLFISFLIEVFVSRALRSNQEKKAEGGQLDASPADIAKAETGNVAIMEAGIIFHSIRMLSCSYPRSRRTLD